jgi:hypothetical protein
MDYFIRSKVYTHILHTQVIVKEKEKIIATGMMRENLKRDLATFYNFVVDTAYRRKGIATTIVDIMLGVKECEFWITLEAAPPLGPLFWKAQLPKLEKHFCKVYYKKLQTEQTNRVPRLQPEKLIIHKNWEKIHEAQILEALQ